jgi:hypothetical protein
MMLPTAFLASLGIPIASWLSSHTDPICSGLFSGSPWKPSSSPSPQFVASDCARSANCSELNPPSDDKTPTTDTRTDTVSVSAPLAAMRDDDTALQVVEHDTFQAAPPT